MTRRRVLVGLLGALLIWSVWIFAFSTDAPDASIAACPPKPSEAEEQHRRELYDLWRAGNVDRMRDIAEAGDPGAQAWMGLMQANRGYSDALNWWILAAEQNNLWAM